MTTTSLTLPSLLADAPGLKKRIEGEALPRIRLQDCQEALKTAVGTHLELDPTTLTARDFEQTGLFSSLLLQDNQGWKEILLRVFPYQDPSGQTEWHDRILELCRFEAERWTAWEAHMAAQTVAGDQTLQEILHAQSPLERKLPRAISIEVNGQRLPALIRRFLPWPSVDRAALPQGRIETLLEVFYKETLPSVIPEAFQLDEKTALACLIGDRGPLRFKHLLTDGQRIVPTRWRSFTRAGKDVTLSTFSAKAPATSHHDLP